MWIVVLHWSIADLECFVGFRCIAQWLSYTHTHIHTHIPFHIRFHYRLLQATEHSSLCCATSPCCLSILHTVVSICSFVLCLDYGKFYTNFVTALNNRTLKSISSKNINYQLALNVDYVTHQHQYLFLAPQAIICPWEDQVFITHNVCKAFLPHENDGSNSSKVRHV